MMIRALTGSRYRAHAFLLEVHGVMVHMPVLLAAGASDTHCLASVISVKP